LYEISEHVDENIQKFIKRGALGEALLKIEESVTSNIAPKPALKYGRCNKYRVAWS